MKQLNIQDAGFIYQETDTTPMHICGVGIYDQTDVKGKRPKIAGILKYINDRMHLAPILKLKLVESVRDIERPYWDEDQNFDIKSHVQQITLDKPGTEAQLHKLVSELIAGPLDRNRPLWTVYVIEGLNAFDNVGKGSFAILTKIHHACIDGASGNNVMSVLHDIEPNAKAVEPPAANDEAKEVVPARGRYENIARAYAKNMIELVEQSRSFSKRAPSLLGTAIDLYRGKKESGAKLIVPDTRFNKLPSADRVYDAAVFSLDHIKQVKNSIPGATVNDVMVTVIAGALNKYLSFHGELPESPLGATLPQNTRPEEMADDTYGNHIGGLFATIHTDITDPLERLHAIHESVSQAKAFASEVDTASIFPNLMGGFLYPRVGKALTRLTQKHGIMERIGPVLTNTIITNVPGPDFALYHQGAKMVHYSGVLPLIDGVGIGHAIYSYFGKITISIVSCPEMMPDADFYIQCCNDAFEELCDAVGLDSIAETEIKTKTKAKAKPKKSKQSVAKVEPVAAKAKKIVNVDAEMIESLTGSTSVDQEDMPIVVNG